MAVLTVATVGSWGSRGEADEGVLLSDGGLQFVVALEVLFVEHLAGVLSTGFLVRDMDDLIGSASQSPMGRGAWGCSVR